MNPVIMSSLRDGRRTCVEISECNSSTLFFLFYILSYPHYMRRYEPTLSLRMIRYVYTRVHFALRNKVVEIFTQHRLPSRCLAETVLRARTAFLQVEVRRKSSCKITFCHRNSLARQARISRSLCNFFKFLISHTFSTNVCNMHKRQ